MDASKKSSIKKSILKISNLNAPSNLNGPSDMNDSRRPSNRSSKGNLSINIDNLAFSAIQLKRKAQKIKKDTDVHGHEQLKLDTQTDEESNQASKRSIRVKSLPKKKNSDLKSISEYE